MYMVWLITGSGNGLGRDIAEAALAAGDNVVEEGETGKG
jgi:NAD(P)-dependent dehydrogenase (short-subunit alcohol dehydrogenase family)